LRPQEITVQTHLLQALAFHLQLHVAAVLAALELAVITQLLTTENLAVQAAAAQVTVLLLVLVALLRVGRVLQVVQVLIPFRLFQAAVAVVPVRRVLQLRQVVVALGATAQTLIAIGRLQHHQV
jgi:hypothetical protein